MPETNDAYDAIVVGLGGMGSAVVAHAARRGLRVLGLEQFEPGHAFGASTGRSRIIRKAYFEDAAYVPLLLRAYELWRELEAQTGSGVLRITGMLMLGDTTSAALAGTRRSAALHALPIEELSVSGVAARFPMVRMRPGEIALVEHDAGFVRPEEAIRAHLAVARARGATLRFGTSVSGWDASENGLVTVTLAGGERYTARTLALCMGPWFVHAAAALGVQLRVQRNVQAWFRPADARFALGTLPIFFVDRPDFPRQLYGFPDMGDGVKAAFHGYGETTTPEGLRRDVSDAEIARLRAALHDVLPGAAGALESSKVCMYALTPDEHFIIAPHPQSTNVVVAGGFSGHGFKFCSVVGEIVADLIERGESRHAIDFLSPKRFAATEA